MVDIRLWNTETVIKIAMPPEISLDTENCPRGGVRTQLSSVTHVLGTVLQPLIASVGR